MAKVAQLSLMRKQPLIKVVFDTRAGTYSEPRLVGQHKGVH